MNEAPEPRRVGLAKRLLPTKIQRPQRVSVVAGAPPYHGDPTRLALRKVIGARHLDRRLHGLGAARHRIEMSVLHRQDRGGLCGVGLQGFGREHRAVHVLGPVQLRFCSLDQGRIAMPDADYDRSAGPV